MTYNVTRRSLQALLVLVGSVALVAGASTVVLGVRSIVGAEDVSGTVDSEMRFYAVWYAAAGAVILRSVPRVETATMTLRAISGLFLVAGCSRGLSWLVVGEPHAVAQLLMVIELALPLVIVPWQTRVGRAAQVTLTAVRR